MSDNYKIPPETNIGHIHLKVSDLKRSMDFYCSLLGFELITTYGDEAAFISAGGYHHHIGLNTWHSKGAPPAPKRNTGLFHTAILYPTRKDLAAILQRSLIKVTLSQALRITVYLKLSTWMILIRMA